MHRLEGQGLLGRDPLEHLRHRLRLVAWQNDGAFDLHRAVRFDRALLNHGVWARRRDRRDEHVAFPLAGVDLLQRLTAGALHRLLRRRAVQHVHRRVRIAGKGEGDRHLAALDRNRRPVETVGRLPRAPEVRLVLGGDPRHERDREGGRKNCALHLHCSPCDHLPTAIKWKGVRKYHVPLTIAGDASIGAFTLFTCSSSNVLPAFSTYVSPSSLVKNTLPSTPTGDAEKPLTATSPRRPCHSSAPDFASYAVATLV